MRVRDAARVAPAIDRDGDGRKKNKRIEFTILVAWPRSEPQSVQRPESDPRVVVAGPRSAPRAPQ